MQTTQSIFAGQVPVESTFCDRRGDANLDGLDLAQSAVVTSQAKALVVVAGAGTGKTRAAIAWACDKIINGVNPGRIAMMTFTNRAAGEVKQRLIEKVGAAGNSVFCGTFHSFAARQMRANPSRIGVPANATIMDDKDSMSAVSICCRKVGIRHYRLREREHLASQNQCVRLTDRKGYCLDDIVGCIKFAIALRQEPGGYLRSLTGEHVFCSLYQEYLTFQRRKGFVDFDHMLLFLLEALQKDAIFRMTLGSQFTHALIDEVQDNNAQQFEMLSYIGSVQKVIIGDPNQLIYCFRGALPDGIARFSEEHPNRQIITLTTNYRSAPVVLAYVNKLTGNAANKFAMVATRASKGFVESFDVESSEDAVLRATAAIAREIKSGVPATEVAVIFRATTHPAVSLLEAKLAEAGVKYKKHGGNDKGGGLELGRFCSILRAAHNPRDMLALMRALHLVPLTTQEHVQDAIEQATKHGIEALQEPFSDMRDAVLRLRNGTHPLDLGLKSAFKLFRDYRIEAGEEGFEERIARVDDALATWLDEGFSLSQIIEAPTSATRGVWRTPEHICLTTIHSAKGLEWDSVHFFWGLPTEHRQMEDSDIEKLNLAYVATTRARDSLHVYRGKFASDAEYVSEDALESQVSWQTK